MHDPFLEVLRELNTGMGMIANSSGPDPLYARRLVFAQNFVQKAIEELEKVDSDYKLDDVISEFQG